MPTYLEYNCICCGLYVRKANTLGKYCSNACQKKYERRVAIVSNTASSTMVKNYIAETVGYFCSECGIDKWNGKKIVLELEHKSGNWEDNSLENVCLLCPNCHSQTNTYKNKNNGNGRHSRRMRYAAGQSY
jgi:hypothetical protein